MSRILAIDPGLANTGVVLFENRRIAQVFMLKTKADGRRPEFGRSVQRGAELLVDLYSLHERIGDIDVAVVESYKDIPGHLRGATNRWTTPLAIGLMYPAIELMAKEVVWQDPERVMTATKHMRKLWAEGRRGLIEGDALITNEHLRSAAAHGSYYLGSFAGLKGR